ncbi:MAG: sigma factor-like helix-turn-helix DNA-binding protein [Lachnospiraceae bacterium]|nr:sigma factor-like helix-turn-helix DNA-binding protein [Lachnospiraceae bacterium]
MAKKEKYYIGISGQSFEVSREVYEVYYKGQRKEKYFMEDLKREQKRKNPKTGEIMVIPSREDSYERLLEAEKQFVSDTESVEELVMRGIILERLDYAMKKLTKEELAIIYALFYQEISELELAKQLGIPRTTLQSRKYKILEKLKKLL